MVYSFVLVDIRVDLYISTFVSMPFLFISDFLKQVWSTKYFFFTRLSVKLFTWFCTNHQTKDNIFKRSNSVLFFNNKHVHIDVGLCNNSCDAALRKPIRTISTLILKTFYALNVRSPVIWFYDCRSISWGFRPFISTFSHTTVDLALMVASCNRYNYCFPMNYWRQWNPIIKKL